MNTRSLWKHLGYAAAGVPLALAATHNGVAAAQPPASPAQGTATWTFHHEYVLGTSLEIRVAAPNFRLAQQAETSALLELDRQDRLLSAWRPDSEFSRWAASCLQPIPVSPELYEVLAAFDSWRVASDGALDASAEAAVRLWRQATSEGRLPTNGEIRTTREAIAQPHWQLDPATHTATRLSAVPLALASFAKSFISSHAADAALHAGATGVVLNLGGDIIVRGSLQQRVSIADPTQDADNDLPLDSLLVRNAAIATSGSYRRGFSLASAHPGRMPAFSHIVDPRSARSTGHILSATVLARDASTAGALATLFSILSPAETEHFAARYPDVAYLLITAKGQRITNASWPSHRLSTAAPVSYDRPPSHPPATSGNTWNQAYDLNIALDLPRIDDARYRRPYVAVWVEDADHFPVRTLALWTQNPRWLPELRQWYRDDQLRTLSENSDISKTVSSATRPPGHYTLRWDGKDNEGKLVTTGKYTLVIEASREHGGYQIERHELNLDAQPQQATLQPGRELGTITLDYRKR